jgi:glutamate/tyrosine decarboxylase-like PLP-dependent enzyme
MGVTARGRGARPSRLHLSAAERAPIWRQVVEAIETYVGVVADLRVAPPLEREKIKALLAPFDFSRPLAPEEAIRFAAMGLTEHQVHTAHPSYYGLFNPNPTTMGIAADALVAAFNPQLAAWSHSPFAAEVEAHVVRALAGRLGYGSGTADGCFTSGGAEANHTALLTALTDAFPAFGSGGARALPSPPVLYVSLDAHDSFLKAARLCGLGTGAVRAIAVDGAFRMDVAALVARIDADRAVGFAPFLVVATMGTTGGGSLDPLPAIADVAQREHLWLHADAAWGGAAALVPELRSALAGLERADSITFDAHKWLSVPMGAGIYLTRHGEILERTFRVATGYMPRDAEGLPVADPYAHSMQWSRRFIGLKVFLSLAVAGWDGYADAIRAMTAMGDRLRARLEADAWRIVNRTPLPVVCFDDPASSDSVMKTRLEAIVRAVVGSGAAWISTVTLGGTTPAIRACITNPETTDANVDALVGALGKARAAMS